MPTIKWLELDDSIIKKIIGNLIMNSFDKFKPEGYLWSVPLAGVSHLIVYDWYVMTDMFPKNSISLDLHEDIEIESIIDSRAATNDPYDIMNH